MANPDPTEVTLNTLHQDLRDLKATLVTGFGSLPTRESSEEMIRLLREANRRQEERFTQLDLRIREQHLEIQQVLRALVEGQRALVEGQRALVEEVRSLSSEIRSLSSEIRSLSLDIKALIARLDALIKGRGDGSPAS
jgi:chromosome segregation ATPase